jgi:hypothetical protein
LWPGRPGSEVDERHFATFEARYQVDAAVNRDPWDGDTLLKLRGWADFTERYPGGYLRAEFISATTVTQVSRPSWLCELSISASYSVAAGYGMRSGAADRRHDTCEARGLPWECRQPVLPSGHERNHSAAPVEGADP